jgi:hypothetical protein
VAAVLHRAVLVVVGLAHHRQQRRPPGFAQRPGLRGGADPRADRLPGDPRVDAAGPEQGVQPLHLEVFGGQLQQAGRNVVLHQRERLILGVTQPFEGVDGGALGQVELARDRVRDGFDTEAEHPRARFPPGLGQVFVQAGQLDLTAHLGVHDLRPDAALADQQPAVDQVPDGPAHGRPGQAEPVGQVDLVL